MTKLPSRRNEFFSAFEAEFDRFFDEFFQLKREIKPASHGYPRFNIFMQDNKLCIEATVPGMKKEDIEISFTPERELVISGSSRNTNENKKLDYFWREIKLSSFERSIVLPEWVKGPPKAELENGILRLEWSIEEPNKSPPTIKVEIQ